MATGNAARNSVTGNAAQKIVWKIAEMPESVDVLNNGFTLTLNKKDPTQSLLLSKVHLTAEDTVTGKILDLAADEIGLNR